VPINIKLHIKLEHLYLHGLLGYNEGTDSRTWNVVTAIGIAVAAVASFFLALANSSIDDLTERSRSEHKRTLPKLLLS
jgi:hypothetical protein